MQGAKANGKLKPHKVRVYKYLQSTGRARPSGGPGRRCANALGMRPGPFWPHLRHSDHRRAGGMPSRAAYGTSAGVPGSLLPGPISNDWHTPRGLLTFKTTETTQHRRPNSIVILGNDVVMAPCMLFTDHPICNESVNSERLMLELVPSMLFPKDFGLLPHDLSEVERRRSMLAFAFAFVDAVDICGSALGMPLHCDNMLILDECTIDQQLAHRSTGQELQCAVADWSSHSSHRVVVCGAVCCSRSIKSAEAVPGASCSIPSTCAVAPAAAHPAPILRHF